MEKLTITTSTKQYPLYIGEGLRFQLKQLLDEVQLTPSSVLVITDDVVAPLYLNEIKGGLSDIYTVYEYIIPSGEAAKSFQNYYEIQTFALSKGLDRHSLIIALGGGVVGDLAGFVAATFMRGIPFIQVPTTLLAHDSSVGGKVAVNHPLGKNMIGAFYQPEMVVYDIETLKSLPEKEWRSGFAEVMKHAFIWDAKFYEWLQENIISLEMIEGKIAEELLKRSISVKAEVVHEDEKETGIRAYLNFGHTLAHAIETELGYGKISHGEAVAIGMIFAMKLSERIFGIDLHVKKIEDWFMKYGYKTTIPNELSPSRLLSTMKKDKKAQSGAIRMVLIKQIGTVEMVTVAEKELLALLTEETGGDLE
ncbi:3-dehydroquinate synthase [Anaerobacillus sp. MEB173]|uniref:3-dehydroquinate synthase n=1 Tax=Anaerobacillus sp. MEB173 TaxID=3383345 RepID=UPI003F91989C